MTNSQKELRKYLLYLSDKMTPEEALLNLQVASHDKHLPLTLKPIIDNYLSLSDNQIDEVRASLQGWILKITVNNKAEFDSIINQLKHKPDQKEINQAAINLSKGIKIKGWLYDLYDLLYHCFYGTFNLFSLYHYPFWLGINKTIKGVNKMNEKYHYLTVQELIDRLNQVKDKSVKVNIYDSKEMINCGFLSDLVWDDDGILHFNPGVLEEPINVGDASLGEHKTQKVVTLMSDDWW